MLVRILLFVLIASVLTGLLLYSQHRPPLEKVSGFIEAHEIRVGSRVGGRISAVKAVEGQAVKAGDVLVELEPYDLQARLAEAQGLLAQRQAALDRVKAGARAEEVAQADAHRNQLRAQLEKLKTGPRPQEVAEAEALAAQAQSRLQLAQQNFDRVSKAYATKTVSQDEMDGATNQLQVAQAEVAVRRERLALLKEGTRKEDLDAAAAQLGEAEQALALLKNGSRSEDVTAAQAAVESQRGAIDALQRQLAELRITAPADGTVEAVDIRPGDLLAPNAPALTLLDRSELWVRAYVPENRLDITTSRAVRVTVDSFPRRDFAGEVTYVSRQAEFTPGNVQTPEERSKQVFRIRVTLKDGSDVLRAGMSADVWLK
jgi:multidrug resistance efflux pump